MTSTRVHALILAALTALASHTATAQPRIAPIPRTTLLAGSPLHLVLDGSDPRPGPLTFTAATSDPLVSVTVLEGNRSLRMRVSGHGEMVFELFDGRARRTSRRIASLADAGFYDGVIFHRVIRDFVIQAGDPTGTGAGGSGLGRFADEFHVDLQHNRTGLLSMAKAGDDTNDSQFFITAGPQRHLDFHHSIFGVLVEGESVREAISEVPVGAELRPLADVVIASAETFVDERNAVIVLKAPEGATGAVDVTVAVRNGAGAETQRTFRVDVVPDAVDSPPFLLDVPELSTEIDTPVSHQLVAVDVESDPAFYLDQNALAANGLPVPVVAHPDLVYQVDFETGLLTITPTNGLTGRHRVSVATAVSPTAVDYQVVRVVVGAPEPTTTP